MLLSRDFCKQNYLIIFYKKRGQMYNLGKIMHIYYLPFIPGDPAGPSSPAGPEGPLGPSAEKVIESEIKPHFG